MDKKCHMIEHNEIKGEVKRMEQNKDNEKKKIPTKQLPTKLTLTIRLLVGAYLLYTAYGLFPGATSPTEENHLFLAVFMIVFAVIGVLLLVVPGRALLQGRYVGGELDAGEEETSGEDTPL